MPLKSTKVLPPGGWIFEQKESGWKLRSMSPFRDAVQQIMLHRTANKYPRSSAEDAASDLENYTCQRLGNDPNFCTSDVKKNDHPFQAAATHLRNLAGRAVGSLSMLANGESVLRDWVGDGMIPVPLEQAQSRANTCADCIFNQEKVPLAFISGPIAEIIHAQLKKKSEMGVLVNNEDALRNCAICGCVLKLKVHVPLRHILEGTPDAMIDKFRQQANHCWLVRELETKTTPAT